MTVQVNGKPTTLSDGATVADLVVALNLSAKRVAVEVNRQLVLKKEWPEKRLFEGDQVEVVTFVGGG